MQLRLHRVPVCRALIGVRWLQTCMLQLQDLGPKHCALLPSLLESALSTARGPWYADFVSIQARLAWITVTFVPDAVCCKHVHNLGEH